MRVLEKVLQTFSGKRTGLHLLRYFIQLINRSPNYLKEIQFASWRVSVSGNLEGLVVVKFKGKTGRRWQRAERWSVVS